MWTYRDSTWTTSNNLVGYDVEATDGSIGKIDEANERCLQADARPVVDTGFWIFGKKRLVPAAVINTVDHDAEKVLNVTKMTKRSKIKIAPPELRPPTTGTTSRGPGNNETTTATMPAEPLVATQDLPRGGSSREAHLKPVLLLQCSPAA